MAIQPSRALGCSDCLIEAIVLHDERRLHQLLSADSAEFSETYWVPRASVLDFMTSFPKSSRDPPLSSQLAAHAEPHCTHPVLAETLETGEQ